MTIQHLLQITISEVLSTLMHAVSVIVWESLVECGGKTWSAIGSVWVSERSWSQFKWFSLDHHGDGNIVVVGWVLDFVSILLSNGLKGVVTNDLSEGLEGHRVNDVSLELRSHLDLDGLNLVDWDTEELGVLLEVLIWETHGGGGSEILVDVLSSEVVLRRHVLLVVLSMLLVLVLLEN